jgi:hypothetical protein
MKGVFRIDAAIGRHLSCQTTKGLPGFHDVAPKSRSFVLTTWAVRPGAA